MQAWSFTISDLVIDQELQVICVCFFCICMCYDFWYISVCLLAGTCCTRTSKITSTEAIILSIQSVGYKKVMIDIIFWLSCVHTLFSYSCYSDILCSWFPFNVKFLWISWNNNCLPLFSGDSPQLHTLFHLPEFNLAFYPQDGTVLLLNTAKVVHGSLSTPHKSPKAILWGSAFFIPSNIFKTAKALTLKKLEVLDNLNSVLRTLPQNMRTPVKSKIIGAIEK